MIGDLLDRPQVLVGHSEIAQPARVIPPAAEASAAEPVRTIVLRIEVKRDKPEWFIPTVKALTELLQLPEDWNSYGAPRVDPYSIAAAISLLASIMRDDSPPPAVVPTGRGGVQLEWHLSNRDLEVELLPGGRILVCYEDLIEQTEWEGELTTDLDAIRKLLQELPSHP